MKSERHAVLRDDTPVRSSLATSRARQVSPRVTDDVLLDAARECVLAVGVRRTTLAEIARTAQVSRMTLYRRFPDVRSVLAALMTREFGALLDEAGREGDGAPHARERLVRSAVAAVRALADNPLMHSVLTRDPELLLPYVVQRLGATQRFAEQTIAELLAEGVQDGSVRATDRAAQARAIVLLAQSFAFSLRPATDGVERDRLLAELAHMLERSLLPSGQGGPR